MTRFSGRMLTMTAVAISVACMAGGCKNAKGAAAADDSNKSQTGPIPQSLLALRENGDRHYERGEYDAAIKCYQQYLEENPGRPEVHSMLGRAYLATGQTALAREQALLAHRLNLNDDQIFASTCEILFADKQYDELMRLCRQRTIDRGRMQDYMLLAEYAKKTGDIDEAQRALLTAAKVDGGMSIQPQLALAETYIAAGDKSRGIERLRMAYFIDPKSGRVAELIRAVGEIPGPSFGIPPAERGTATVPTPTPGR